MITGTVNADLEATLRLVVQGPAGGQQLVEALLDTGFSQFLTLPSPRITALGLTWIGFEHGVLADGSIEQFAVYQAEVIWDGQPRTVKVQAIDAMPLLGMAMLRDHELRVKVRDAGDVVIEPLP